MSKDVVKTFRPDDFRKYRNKWNSIAEFETVEQVRNRYDEMALARRTSCPYPTIGGVSSDNKDTGSDWADRWNQDLKLWSMWGLMLPNRSNLKSPTSYAPIEAAMAEFQDNQIKATLTAIEEEDAAKARIYEKALDHLYYSANLQNANNETFKSTNIFGNAFSHVAWVRKARDVEIIKNASDVKKEIRGKRKEIKEAIDNGKPYTEKTEVVEYDDIAVIPVSVFEFYVDPDARVLRGPAYEAVDCIWRTTPSLEQFRAEYRKSNDPWVIKKNIDKVHTAYTSQEMYEDSIQFFKTPSDIQRQSKVEVLKYYNKQTDSYIVVANDVVIRMGPLPYNHKQLPFVHHKLIEFPDIFYGIGLPTLLEHNQAEDETLRNLNIDQLKLATNPPLIANSMVFPDIDQQWERAEPGLKLSIDGDVSPGNIRFLEIPGSRYDYYQMRNTFSEDAVKISGINPIMSAYPRSNTAVRTNMLVLESGLKHVKKYVKNWSRGYIDALRQIIMLMKQFYPDMYSEEVDGDGNKVRKYKTIRTNGEVILSKEDGTIEIKKEKGEHYFELNESYLDLTGDLEVEIDIDTLLPMSRTVKMQKIEAALAQLTPIVANPMIRNAPGMITLIQEYIRTHALPSGVSDDFQDENTEKEREQALMQNDLMMQGQEVEGMPGESNTHKLEHLTLLVSLQNEMTMAMQEQTADPAVMTQAQQVMQRIMRHLGTDDMDKTGGNMPGMPQGGGAPQATGPQIPSGQSAPANKEPSAGGGGPMPPMPQLP